MQRLDRLLPHAIGKFLARGVVGIAGFGRDRESRRHGQAGARHLGDPGALSAEQVAHVFVAFLEEVDPFFLGGCARFGTCLCGDGHAKSSSRAQLTQSG